MTAPSQAETRAILTSVGQGEEPAERLLPLVYDELHNIAEHCFRRESAGQTLQPTALVHEAYLKLVGRTGANYNGRTHFLAVAATVMRQILIDRARRRAAVKHGGGRERLTLLEGFMAIQRIIDEENIPYDGDGKRLPLDIAMVPNYQPRPQPAEISVGAT